MWECDLCTLVVKQIIGMMLGRLTSQFRSVPSQRFFHERAMEKMTQRTFEEGTPWPPLKENALRLYSMRFCPYAQRARLVLAHKNIEYETVNVDLKRKPSWLFERNPKGRVPVLEHPDGRIVFESLLVSQYLDEIYPQHPLTPTDPYKKALDRLLPDFCEKLMRATYQLMFTGGSSEKARVTYLKGCTIYEWELNKRLPHGPFFGGDQPAMADYMIWPWFERLPMIDDQKTSNTACHVKTPPTNTNTTTTTPADADTSHPVVDLIGVRASQFPRLHRWMSAMFTLPAVKATMFDLGSHRRFMLSQLTADPVYDMGLEGEPPLPHLSTAKL